MVASGTTTSLGSKVRLRASLSQPKRSWCSLANCAVTSQKDFTQRASLSAHIQTQEDLTLTLHHNTDMLLILGTMNMHLLMEAIRFAVQ